MASFRQRGQSWPTKLRGFTCIQVDSRKDHTTHRAAALKALPETKAEMSAGDKSPFVMAFTSTVQLISHSDCLFHRQMKPKISSHAFVSSQKDVFCMGYNQTANESIPACNQSHTIFQQVIVRVSMHHPEWIRLMNTCMTGTAWCPQKRNDGRQR